MKERGAEKFVCSVVGNGKGMRRFGKYGDINVRERIILKWTLKKQDVVVYWTLTDRNRLK